MYPLETSQAYLGLERPTRLLPLYLEPRYDAGFPLLRPMDRTRLRLDSSPLAKPLESLP